MDKYKNLTAEERDLLDKFPGLTAEELETVNDMFEHYVFYKTVKDGRRLWTSCCHQKNKHYSAMRQLVTPEHREFLSARHNDVIVCPYCGRRATLKAAGIPKGCLTESYRIVFLHCLDGELFAQAYYVRKDYNAWGLDQSPYYACSAVYHFRIGRALMFYEGYNGSWHVTCDSGKIARRPNVRDPFFAGGLCGRNDPYLVIHPEALEQSSLKYCGYFNYWRGLKERLTGAEYSMMRFLAVYCVYPRAVEMLLKNGIRDAVADMVFEGKKNAAAIKWGEQDPGAAFGLKKEELRAFLALPEKKIDVLTAYKRLKKFGLPEKFSKIAEAAEMIGWRTSIKTFTGECIRFRKKPNQLMTYFQRFTGGCHIGGYRSMAEIYGYWRDYIRAAEAIGYDLSQEVVAFPRNLDEYHDRATAEHRRRLQAELEEQRRRAEAERAARDREYAKSLEEARLKREAEEKRRIDEIERRRKKYTYEADGYIIRPAENADEIIAEGQALQHCVAGYADRHARGVLTICFLRRASEPEKPLITIEMSNTGKLMQAHGYKNEREVSHITGKIIAPDPRKAYGFILNPWLAWVKAGSKRDKDGNPILPSKGKGKKTERTESEVNVA